MKNINKNKAAFAIALGILLIIVLTTTMTYAFYTYYRTGQKNQLIVTGRIKLIFQDGENNINLTNQFPITDASAMSLPNNVGDVATADFTVSGYAGSSITLEYNVYAIAGSSVSGKTRMPDSDIKIYLTETHDYGEVSIENDFDYHSGSVYGALASGGRDTDTGSGGEILLASGVVGTTDSVHSYTMRMWISDAVTISDTDTNTDYCASSEYCLDNRTVFSNLYYSIKIKVENVDVE